MANAALVYIKHADEELAKQNYNEAGQNYLKASEYYLNKFKKADNKEEQDFCKAEAERLYNEGMRYIDGKPPSKKTRIANEPDEDQPINISESYSKKSYKDVAGMDNLKKTLEEYIIWPVTEPDIFDKALNKKNTGLILYGPPGCGKTLLVEAAVGEANLRSNNKIKFYNVKITDVKNKWVGDSEKNLEACFKAAAEHEPAVLFFDELDALGGVRDYSAKHSYELVNAFLQDFQIINDKQVLVVGATNNPHNIDPALSRSGRFGRPVLVVPPNAEARQQIFKLSTKKASNLNILSDNIDYKHLAELTDKYSSSDIVEICDTAIIKAKRAVRRNGRKKVEVTLEDFVEAVGEKKSSLGNWISKAKADFIDMNKYKYNKEICFKAGVSEDYIDLVKLIFDLEGKKVVEKGGYYFVETSKPSEENAITENNYYYKDIGFQSKGERICAALLIKYGIIDKPILKDNCQFVVDGKAIDFFPQRKMFIEYHPCPSQYDARTPREYFNDRRKLLDAHGYQDYELAHLVDLDDFHAKVLPFFKIQESKDVFESKIQDTKIELNLEDQIRNNEGQNGNS